MCMQCLSHDSKSSLHYPIAFDKDTSSIQSFHKMHLIIVKGIEIYFPKSRHLQLDGLNVEQCSKIVICKLKVYNYI